MLNFFRRIRRKLADDNKPMKYMRYAIGEIVLVVIGILIALQINNWNEGRKQNTVEIQYLNRLSTDLSTDIKYYNRRISDSENIIDYHRNFIHQLYQKQSSLDDLKNLFSNITWNSEQLTSQNSTYIELTNSGNLNIFRNQELRVSIINYYREYEKANNHFVEFNEFSVQCFVELGKVIPDFTKFYSLHDDLYEGIDIHFNEQFDFFNDPTAIQFKTLEYAIAAYKFKHSVFLNYFRTLKEMSNQLLQDVLKELESRE